MIVLAKASNNLPNRPTKPVSKVQFHDSAKVVMAMGPKGPETKYDCTAKGQKTLPTNQTSQSHHLVS
jgi:hypothetical protein